MSQSLNMMSLGHRMMSVALNAAGYGLGRTGSNPCVGAVVWHPGNGIILSVARTADGGRPHAETQAIEQADEAIKATGYPFKLDACALSVTLEPCAHEGQTPPCVDAIRAAGLSRVDVACRDPDPRVGGRGIARLQQAGVEVNLAVCAEQAQWQLAGFLLRVAKGRALCQAKIATDSEGRIAQGDDGPVWVTGARARAHGHLMRAQADAIMVGTPTVLTDNPSLTCRLPGLAVRQPVPVLVDRQGLLDGSSKVFAAEGDPLVVSEVAGRAGSVSRTVLKSVTPDALLREIGSRDLSRVLLEGGPRLVRAFLDVDCVDELLWYRASTRFDGRAVEGVTAEIAHRLNDDGLWQKQAEYAIGGDHLLRFRRRKTLSTINTIGKACLQAS